MKTIMMYRVLIGEEVKFSSIVEDEVRDVCQTLYESSGVLPIVESVERIPVDHRK